MSVPRNAAPKHEHHHRWRDAWIVASWLRICKHRWPWRMSLCMPQADYPAPKSPALDLSGPNMKRLPQKTILTIRITGMIPLPRLPLTYYISTTSPPQTTATVPRRQASDLHGDRFHVTVPPGPPSLPLSHQPSIPHRGSSLFPNVNSTFSSHLQPVTALNINQASSARESQAKD